MVAYGCPYMVASQSTKMWLCQSANRKSIIGTGTVIIQSSRYQSIGAPVANLLLFALIHINHPNRLHHIDAGCIDGTEITGDVVR